MKYLLIDAIFINNGGGKVLLDYLMEKLEQTNWAVYYLLDNRIKENTYNIKIHNKIEYMKPSLLSREVFYRKKAHLFNKVFVLGNVPPLIKVKAQVYCYFHNAIYIDVPSDFNYKEQVKFFLKIAIIKYASKNADKWLVQTSLMKNKMIEKFHVKNDVIQILPFFPPFLSNISVKPPKKNTFLYVSNAQENKNHTRLISAFINVFQKYPDSELIVTVSEEFPRILDLIRKAKKLNVSITNLGFVNREELAKIYEKAEFLIFPSLSESFGLGIVEAISFGCKVIVSDLPYAHSVCKPSLTFNPFDVKSIENAIEVAIAENCNVSESHVTNDIDNLIKLLTT